MIEKIALDDPAWTSFVARAPGALPFHHPAWALMIAGCYAFEAFALALSRPAAGGDGRLIAGVPVIELRHPLTRRRRWSSLPFTDVCPPLVAPEDSERFMLALDGYRAAHGVSEFEISGAFPGAEGQTSARHVEHVLALDADPAVVARRYRSSVRRNVRIARTTGLRLRRAETESDVTESFYRLQVMTRRRLGLPPQPLRLFRALWREVLAPGLGHLTLVEQSGRPIAVGIFLRTSGVTVYKYGASDPASWSLRPNNLLFAHEIEAACLAGDHSFHFGRTDLHDEGLRRFKLGWGADEQALVYTRLGIAREEAKHPSAVVRAVIRRSPPFVARMVGEALYRFAA